MNKTKPRRDGEEHAGRLGDGVFSQFISFSQFFKLLSNFDLTGQRFDGVIFSLCGAVQSHCNQYTNFLPFFSHFKQIQLRETLASLFPIVCLIFALSFISFWLETIMSIFVPLRSCFGYVFSGVMNGIDIHVSQIMCNIMLSTAMMECITFSDPPRNLYASRMHRASTRSVRAGPNCLSLSSVFLSPCTKLTNFIDSALITVERYAITCRHVSPRTN